MRIAGRSGIVMDLPDRLAKSLLRTGAVEAAPPPEPTQSEIRRWARKSGVDCPARGRIPKDIVDKYRRKVMGG